jgi:hypothetical protein
MKKQQKTANHLPIIRQKKNQTLRVPPNFTFQAARPLAITGTGCKHQKAKTLI